VEKETWKVIATTNPGWFETELNRADKEGYLMVDYSLTEGLYALMVNRELWDAQPPDLLKLNMIAELIKTRRGKA
jgi:hypothetical protein